MSCRASAYRAFIINTGFDRRSNRLAFSACSEIVGMGPQNALSLVGAQLSRQRFVQPVVDHRV
jgi:hypothetical protein